MPTMDIDSRQDHRSASSAPKQPAKKFPFELDEWQKKAVGLIDAGQSLMVAAHTSAGKTSVAEYAIASALRDQRRVIYTSPIKALSNQKFRELQLEFGEGQVGLKTGDLSLNPDAPCLVMTTEILRNMLYRSAGELEEVQWIVFDEIHYMRDRERGVVWEEAIILCPKLIKLVFLSATLSNAEQFAEWVSTIQGSSCEVIQTPTRPIPLHHYVFIKGEGEGIYLVSDPTTSFNEKNFDMAIMRAAAAKEKAKNIGIQRLLFMLVQQNYHPAILFCFSRRECEANALMLENLTLNTPQEEELVQTIFDNALECLSEEDRNLPQALNLLPLLRRGIGVHHGGMLPILKEIVELLFQESLVKVLCATETFALGVNMPAKTVIFTALDKFDGENRRSITSSEYIQMSGRAGRRGKDPFGLSIMMIDQNQSKEAIQALVDIHTDPLISQFRLTYNSILNMSRSDLHNPELLLRNSFLVYLDGKKQDDSLKLIDDRTHRASEIQKMITMKDPDRFDSIDKYFRFSRAIQETQAALRSYICDPSVSLPFIQPGRVVFLASKEEDKSNEGRPFGWGIVVGCQKLFAPSKYCLHVLVNARTSGADDDAAVSIEPSSSASEAHVLTFHFDAIRRISSVRMFLPDDLIPFSTRKSLMKKMKTIIGSPEIKDLHPVDDMNMSPEKKAEYGNHQKKLEQATSILSSLPVPEQFEMAQFENYLQLQSEINELKASMSNNSLNQFKTELRNRLRLLRRLQYLDNEGVVLQKGRIACEIDSLDEIVSTELIVDGVFQGLSPAETAALVSCLQLDQEKRGPAVPKQLETQFAFVKKTARKVAEISVECDMSVNVEDYVNQFSGTMAAVVLDWANGIGFSDLCAKYRTVFEGSIIRNLRRLQEVLLQLTEGAQCIGNDAFREQFESARRSIHRGIPFAGSLYL